MSRPLRHTEEETREQDGRYRTVNRKKKRRREDHTSACPESTFDTAPSVSMDLNQATFFSEPKYIKFRELVQLFIARPFHGAAPKFLFLPACIVLSGIQTGVKEEQIDTPSGRCLAWAVCGILSGKDAKTQNCLGHQVKEIPNVEECWKSLLFYVREGSCAMVLIAIHHFNT